jgi:CDP-diacylglycerol--serine O-phosphatidyltransferase
MNAQSSFGAQYDSLSDMCAFGVAPALVVYRWSISTLGKLGWLAAFLYTAATALRLARFNIKQADSDPRYFQGLSCTASAGVMAGMVWMGASYGLTGLPVAIFVAVITLIMAALMVSSIRYSSFKSIDFKGSVSFLTVVLAVILITAVAIEPPEVLLSVFGLYAASGPIAFFLSLIKRK